MIETTTISDLSAGTFIFTNTTGPSTIIYTISEDTN
jgi:hypothetical protein